MLLMRRGGISLLKCDRSVARFSPNQSLDVDTVTPQGLEVQMHFCTPMSVKKHQGEKNQKTVLECSNVVVDSD